MAEMPTPAGWADHAARWLSAQPRWVRAILLAVLGGIIGLGQAPFGFWWASIAGLSLFFIILPGLTMARAHGWAGFWLGLGYFGFSLRWIVSPFLVDIERHGWMAPFALLLMAAGAATFWAVALWSARRFAPGSGTMPALTLAGVEALRSLILTGFPWALIGHVWVGTNAAHWAAIVGPHGLTLLATILAAGIASLFRDRNWGVAPVTAVAICLVLPVTQLPTVETPIIRLVQPNAPQDEKWDIDKRQVFFDRMLAFTAEAPRPDLVVWPETAIPTLLNYAAPELEQVAEAAQGTPVITGINRAAGPLYHNAQVLLGRGAEVQAIYDKTHLVPFGEYVPFGNLMSRFGIHGFAASEGAGFSPRAGGQQGLMDLPGIGPARALICYEGIFAEEISTPDRPRLMVLITNDAWFGGGAGPAQHLAQARLRAIEQGLPMVRVANTGISAMINARGEVVAMIPLGQPGFLDTVLPPARAATFYTRWGDVPALTLILLWLLGRGLRARRNSD